MQPPSEMIARATRNAARFLAPVDEARRRGEYEFCYTNLDIAFRDTLLAGLIEWRHRIGRPRERFFDALRIAAVAREMLPETSGTDGVKLFHFSIAAIVAYLIDECLTDSMLAGLPPSGGGFRNSDAVSRLDAAVVVSIRSGRIAVEFEALLMQIENNKRMGLLHETYTNYLHVLQRCEGGRTVDGEIMTAERLFEERKRNAYYHSSRIDGGGPDNAETVDFRLGAILKYCTQHHPGMVLPDTPHRWIW